MLLNTPVTTTPSPVARVMVQRQRRLVLLALSLMLGWGGLLVWLSSARYTGYNVGMLDLGNMTQAIADGAHGGPLRFTAAEGTRSRLGGHAELIYFALAALYRLWPDPRMLLVVQTALVVSGVWPVVTLARRLGSTERGALYWAVGYLLLPTAVAAALFDLHGDTLAMPLLLWLLAALARRAWRQALFWAVASLACKWYIAAPVGVLGLTLVLPRTAPFDLAATSTDARGARWLGVALCGLAAGYGALVLLGLHHWFGSASSTATTGGMGSYARFYFGDLGSIGWLGVLDRLVNVLAVVVPTAFLWRRAPWTTLPALAIIIPAALTTGPGAAYAWSYHHYAAAVPFLVAGSIDGARRSAQSVTPQRRMRQTTGLAGVFGLGALVFHIGLSDTPLGIPFWRAVPGGGADASGYGHTSRDRLKDRWLHTEVASGTPIAVSNFLAPHVADRRTLYLVRYPDEGSATSLARNLMEIDAAYPDALFDYLTLSGDGYAGGVAYDHGAIQQLLQAPDWGLVNAQDGLLHFAHHPPPDAILPQTLRSVVDPGGERARFGARVALVGATVEPVGSGHGKQRWRMTVRWRALQPLDTNAGFPISRLDGVPDARIVHLPLMVLRPNLWPANTVLEEQFDWELPSGVAPGTYTWHIGWYDSTNPCAAQTDARSRIGSELVMGRVDVR